MHRRGSKDSSVVPTARRRDQAIRDKYNFPCAAHPPGQRDILHQRQGTEPAKMVKNAATDENALVAVGDSSHSRTHARQSRDESNHGMFTVEMEIESPTDHVYPSHLVTHHLDCPGKQHRIRMKKQQHFTSGVVGAEVHLVSTTRVG